MIEQRAIELLAQKYQGYISQSHRDLFHSGLHADFIADCIGSIDAKIAKEGRLPIGEMFPLIVAEGMTVSPDKRRSLAAACLALYGYTRLLDSHLDTSGTMNARNSMSASALLGWGLSVFSEATARTPYANVFLNNVMAAFSAQHYDLQNRKSITYDRSLSDADKNRAIVAIVAAFCASSEGMNERLLDASEILLAPFQKLDDLVDLQDDVRERNLSSFVKLALESCPDIEELQLLPASALYQLVIADIRSTQELQKIAIGFRSAISLLRPEVDQDLHAYISYLEASVLALANSFELFQKGEISEIQSIEAQIRQVRVDV